MELDSHSSENGYKIH